MKRSMATLVLLAFVLAGALPCQAAGMSCGMKMPTPQSSCGACMSAPPSAGPVLKAGSCCRSEPGRDRSTAPAVLSAAGPGSHSPVKAMLATVSAPAAAVLPAASPLWLTSPGDAGAPLSSSHTTVLRL